MSLAPPPSPPTPPHERGHDHAHARGWRAHAALLRTRWGRVLGVAVGLLALVTVVGLVLLWPGGPAQPREGTGFDREIVSAEVVDVLTVRCPGPVDQRCRDIVVAVDDGPDDVRMSLGPQELVPDFAVGDGVRVQRLEPMPGGALDGAGSGAAAPDAGADGAGAGAPDSGVDGAGSDAGAGATGLPDPPAYGFVGPERGGTLLILAAAFAVLVLVMARWRGLLALGGFVLSLGLIVEFVVPAILAGESALVVAFVGALAVTFVTVGLTYGLTAQSAAATLGIAVTLLFATVVGALALDRATLDGREGELSGALIQNAGSISLQGIVLAGLVLGALGVLADMAVTQASTVMAVRRANPQLSARRLYQEGFAVGRDHLVATTHTLVLAYAGATLPLLLVLQSGGASVGDAINMHDLAEPIVATLVGSMALLVSVPITTALAAAVVARIPASALPASGGHDHHHH